MTPVWLLFHESGKSAEVWILKQNVVKVRAPAVGPVSVFEQGGVETRVTESKAAVLAALEIQV